MINVKTTYTLGICTMGSSSAALFKNGVLISAVEEERLSRRKNDNRFPSLAIEEVLDIEGISLKNIDIVAVYWQPWRIFTRVKGTFKKFFISSISRKAILKRLKDMVITSNSERDSSWSDLFILKKLLLEKDSEFKGIIKFFDHHLTHQKYGEQINSWENCISLSYDGGGEGDSTILSVIEKGKKRILSRHQWPNSLGHFYSTFTGFLGFKMLEGEYKMMGLAPYGKPVYKDLILDKILNLKNGGRYKLNIEICDYHAALRGEFHKELSKLFGEKRLENQIPTQNHINLACSVQLAFEECLKHILSLAVEQYPNIRKLVITGGCALNVTANGKLISSNFVDNVIIPPAPHDAGCAIGAGLCAIKTNINSQSVRTPFLEENSLEILFLMN